MSDRDHISILIVDDEPNLRKTLSAILVREGYDVKAVSHGEEAVEICSREKFDVVLMDVRMPRLDGIDAFRQIRRHQEAVRVILMSGYGEDDLKQAALEDGAIAFVDKPLNVEHVIRLIADATETAILVVEDDEVTARTLTESLEQQNFHVTTVGSSHDALELIEQIKFDIILIDVALPTMNGLDLYLAIKKITPSSVAIMVTGLEEEFVEVAQAAIRQTAYTMVHKPIDLPNLFKLLSRIQRQQASNSLRKPSDSD